MTKQPFPLGGVGAPTWYVATSPTCVGDGTFSQAGPPVVVGLYQNRYGIYRPGDTVEVAVKFGASTSTLTTYTVRDWYGNVVASGTPTFDVNNVMSPGSSFIPGWYRVYLSGTNTDSNYGAAYASTNFAVVPASANLPTLPASKFDFTHGKFMPDGFGWTDAQVAAGAGGPVFNNGVDIIMRACLGIPMGRLSLFGSQTPFNPDGGASDRLTHDNLPYCQGVLHDWYLNPANPNWLDPVRPRPVFMEFPNGGTYDAAYLGICQAYVKNNTVDGSKVYVSSANGSLSGAKIQVFYPNSSTLVETYDNLASGTAAEAAVNGVSNYILIANTGNGQTNVSPTTIGNSCRTGVMQVVSELYPLGVTHYEGPSNEPQLTSNAWILAMKVFSDAVHDGHAGAKAIGPCTVDITTQLDHWRLFLTGGTGYSGGGAYCDEFSFHDYNTTLNGDINQGRANLEGFLSMLNEFGLRNKPLWQTEATGGNSAVIQGPIFFPRRARAVIGRVLLGEQYGIPREKNPYWYDQSHGFWGDPCWLMNADYSLQPQAILLSTLGRETFGQNHHHRIDFGSVTANNLFLGSVYGSPLTGSTAVMVCTSAMPSSTVTLTVNGLPSGGISVVDAFGNVSTVTPSSGLITVNVNEAPTYLRLPAGVTVSVYKVRDWAHNPSPSISATRTSNLLGGVSRAEVADDQFFNFYGGDLNNTGIAFSTIDLPDTCEIKFAGTVSVERILVFCGPSYQAMPAIFTYTVETWDGTSWTTQNTVTKTPAASIHFGDSGNTTGTTYDQYWDEQWVDDVALTGGPLSCKGVRVSVSATSYGGAVDSNANSVGDGWGASVDDPRLTIQEIQVVSATSVSVGTAYDTLIESLSPVGYWKLNETAGATTAVSQVNAPGVNGATSNVTFGRKGLTNGADTAAFFSATSGDAHIAVADSSALHVGDTFSVECWFFTTIESGGQFQKQLIYKAGGGYGLTMNGSVITLVKTGSPDLTVCSATLGLIPYQTYHVVATKTGSTVKMYVNGQDVTGTVTNQTCGNGGTLTFGSAIANAGMTLQKIAVYPSALSASAVAANWVAGVQPVAPANLVSPRVEGG